MSRATLSIFFLLSLCLGCGSSNPTSSDGPTQVSDSQFTTTSTGLKYFDLSAGTGDIVESGQRVSVHYTGWLQSGQKFDSSRDRNQPFSFVIGTSNIIPGWNEGVEGMRVGGTRQLLIPPGLAYGERGSPPVIPPNATLVFEIEVLNAE